MKEQKSRTKYEVNGFPSGEIKAISFPVIISFHCCHSNNLNMVIFFFMSMIVSEILQVSMMSVCQMQMLRVYL